MIRIVFAVVASLGLLMALGTVLARNLVHAALFLVGFFFLVACQFILLEAEFMAAMQVLVYIGAVAILLLFGIMLTRNIQGDETTGGSPVGKALAAVVGVGLLVVLVTGIAGEAGIGGRRSWTETRARFPAARLESPTQDARSRAINNMSTAVGREMMTRFAVPFEVAGLLLTAALVGAIALAQGEEDPIYPRLGAARTQRGSTTEGDGDAPSGPLGAPTPPTASVPR